jgi:hypothetical protein
LKWWKEGLMGLRGSVTTGGPDRWSCTQVRWGCHKDLADFRIVNECVNRVYDTANETKDANRRSSFLLSRPVMTWSFQWIIDSQREKWVRLAFV